MLVLISWITLGIGLVSSLIIIVDVIKHPQIMKVMNIVWPINGWFLGPLALWTYFKWGRLKAKNLNLEDKRGKPAKVFVSTSHCSAGCTVVDAIGVPIVALTALTIAGSTLFAHYTIEFILAFAFGIVFQFFAIFPMNKKQGIMRTIKEAVKADSLALTAFEIGMFG